MVENHKPYEQVVNRPCDFIVKYKFFIGEKDGRTSPPTQGYRSDFMYAEDKAQDGLWMIWPEFLDQNNKIILDKSKCVGQEGKAQMWIINEHLIERHRLRLKIGQKCFFMEGPHKVAECEVVEVIGLKSGDT